MITTLTISLISFALVNLMLLNKKREMNRGRGMFTIGTVNSDQKVTDYAATVVSVVQNINVASTKRFAVKQAVKIEQFAMGVFERLATRFTIFGEVVTGRNIPKNRGSVSFFLKNIEDSKKRSVK